MAGTIRLAQFYHARIYASWKGKYQFPNDSIELMRKLLLTMLSLALFA